MITPPKKKETSRKSGVCKKLIFEVKIRLESASVPILENSKKKRKHTCIINNGLVDDRRNKLNNKKFK